MAYLFLNWFYLRLISLYFYHIVILIGPTPLMIEEALVSIVFSWESLILWQSSKQKVVARSRAKSEYRARE